MTDRHLMMSKMKRRTETQSSTEHLLNSPMLLFVKIVPRIEKRPYVYWYSYSIGRVKNIFWGYYKVKTHTFSLQGSCHFRYLEALNETIVYKQRQGFTLVSVCAKNQIGATLHKYLSDEIEVDLSLNRSDMNQKYQGHPFYRMMTDDFLHYAERNQHLMKNTEQTCLRLESCQTLDEFGDSRSPRCDQFFYGEPGYQHEKDFDIV